MSRASACPRITQVGLLLACGLHAVAAIAQPSANLDAQLAAMPMVHGKGSWRAVAAAADEPQVIHVTPGEDLDGILGNATEGDVIELSDGYYPVTATLLISVGMTVRATNAGKAVLDGQGQHRILTISSGRGKVVLDGLSITRGSAETVRSHSR